MVVTNLTGKAYGEPTESLRTTYGESTKAYGLLDDDEAYWMTTKPTESLRTTYGESTEVY